MTLSALPPAARHRAIAADLGAIARQVADWDAPAPVEGWTAQDVVDHLVTWFPGFLAGGGVALPPGPPVADDPAAAWTRHTDAVQQLLESDRASLTFEHPRLPPLPLDAAIDRFYTVDVFMHTWDLATAAGVEVALDPGLCAQLLDGMTAMEDAIRGSGQYGPAVHVPADADPQARLLGFIGRDPSWSPPRRD